MATYIAGSGGGGKGGGGSARVAVEAPNTLKSKSYAKIVEVLCEGEIEGLANGMQSVYLDGVQLQNADGTFNYDDVVLETREGTLSQGVTRIGNTTEITTSVGTEIKQAVSVLHTISNADVDRARVAIRIPALSQQNTKNGDLNGAAVKLKIEYNPNGSGWIEAPVGISTINLNPEAFTGVSSVSGNVTANSIFNEIGYCTGQQGNKCRTEITYYPSVATIQYNKDNEGWITFKTVQFKGANQTIPFNLDTILTSSYKLRVLFSASATGYISFLNGSVTSGEVTISGKTTSPYEKEYEFILTGDAPWVIRVTRLTADSASSALQDKTYLSAVTSVFEEKFRYPATAYIALSIDAEQFSSIPQRAYDVKLLKIKVPTNYDTLARTYTGIWDGTFKVEWSDNPAWCFYDLITNKRYGLGERIAEAQVDKWALYDISQYCDELVDNGTGILEPRFTCNVFIQTREEAYKVLQDMASIFAGITYWGSSSEGFQGIVPVQDKPQDAYSYVFNNSNVIDGIFSYQTANNNTQFNTVYVTYNDPLDEYKQKVVYVADDELIAQDAYVNETSVVAFGCTSKAQAIRLGRRVLYTNKYENDIVSFSVGADGIIPSIGSVVQISDELRAGERRGGRVVEALGTSSIKVDSEFELQNDVEYKISFIDSTGSWQEVVVTSAPATTDVLTFAPALLNGVAKNSPFILSNAGLQAALYKVVSISEVDQHNYTVSAVKHIPTKYGYIDDLIPVVQQDTSDTSLNSTVTDLTYNEVLYYDGINVKSKLVVSWTPAKFSSSFLVNYRQGDSNTTSLSTVSPSFEILDTTPSTYSISVVSINTLGGRSLPSELTVEVLGKTAPPAGVTGLAVSSFSNAANLSWDRHVDLDVVVGGFIDIRHTTKTVGYKWEDGTPVALISGGNTSATVPLLNGTYMAKAVDSGGAFSTTAAFADSSFAQIQQFNVVVSNAQQTGWLGAKTNVYKNGDYISLSTDGTVDDIVKLWDELNSVDTGDFPSFTAGVYEFDNYLDVGSVITSRVSSLVDFLAYDIVATIDGRLDLIDTWTSVDGGDVNGSYVYLQISTTEDDPSTMGAVWTPWKTFLIGDYKARAFKFKLIFVNENVNNSINVYKAEVSVDVPDRVVGEEDIVCPVGGYSVVYDAPFFSKPAVAIRIDDMQQGDYTEFVSNTNTGFTVKFKDVTHTYVSRQFDYISKGFGYVHI